ncbi:MAG: transposase [Gammaproteobacteria bacterium]|nr:transposase [Gammaproteobacteria bacterium]MDH3468798.1 transposase [Gammaproteobacteria bacterium]
MRGDAARPGRLSTCVSQEYLNDHEALRRDVALRTAVDRMEELASSSTLCRWENRAARAAAWRMNDVFAEQSITPCFGTRVRCAVCPVRSSQKNRASYSTRSSLIHSCGYESSDDRPESLARIPLNSEPFMQYAG